jgi:S-adenosylmethionine-dependent methyltransferase
MAQVGDAFDQGVTAYQDWAETPWGRLRTEMIWRQLQPHLPKPGGRILDAGCGLGQLAIRLALAGHQVTAFDFAAEMITAARERAAQAGATVDWRQLSVEGVSTSFPPASFEAVLCHSLLPYVADPESVVGDLAGLLEPGGMLSLVGHNPRAAVLRTAVWQRDFAAALAQLEHPTHHSPAFDLDLQLHAAETVEAWLYAVGLEVMARYGVRVVNDLITDNTVKYDPCGFAELLKLEMALCDRSPYRDIAVYHHFVAQRTETP